MFSPCVAQIIRYLGHPRVLIGLLLLLSLQPAKAASSTTKSSRRAVTLEWQEIKGARKYELELTPIKEGQPIKKRMLAFKTSKTYWDGYIAPGLYSMRLRSLDWRGVPGDWSEPEEVTIRFQKIGNFSPLKQHKILSSSPKEEMVVFSWEGFPGALSFQVSIWSKDNRLKITKETSEPRLEVALPVADEYSWTVHPIKVQGVESDPNEEILDFTIIGKALEKPEIEKPADEFVRNLEWEPVEFAQIYNVKLERKERKSDQWLQVIQLEQKETSLKFNPEWRGGTYRLSVVAKAPLRESSPVADIEFKVKNGDRSREAQTRFQFLLAKRRTNNWFVLASYLITEMNYSSVNVDLGSSPSAKVLGGTGRLGLGFLNEKLAWGYLGIVDQSGFIFENKIYNYPAIEALGIYRASIRLHTETRLSSGLYYKEVPEILGNIRNNSFTLSQLKMFGVQAGIEHLIQFDEKLGAQVNARVYLPTGGKTPNNKSILLTPSYQIGIMGSLRLRQNAWGHAGYAYRKDAIRYESNYQSDAKYNETSVTGSYLNLYLEWGL